MKTSSDVDTHWSYADPDSQNLVNADPDQGRIQDNKITNFISKKKKYLFFKSVPKP